MRNRTIENTFIALIFLILLTPIWVFADLLFPFVTSKAFYFRVIVELALPFYAFLLVVNKELRPKWNNPLTLFIVLFWLVNLVSSFMGVNVIRSLWGNFERMGGTYYLLHLVLLYFYLLALAKLRPTVFAVFLKTLVWCAGILAFYGVLTRMGMGPIVKDPSLPLRISIIFGNPIYVGSFMILPMFLSAFFASQEEEKWKKYLFWVLVFMQFLAIYFSGTRGAIVSLIAGLFLAGLLYVILTKNKTIRIWGMAAILLFIGLSATIYLNHEKLPQGSTLNRVFNLNDSNTQSRLLQWKTALKGMREYWLIGTGPENYYIVANKYHNPEMAKYDKSWFDKPHNYLLEVLVTTGAFGFVLYALIFIFSIISAYKAYSARFFGLGEFIIISIGLSVYQMQNLFVFDNVSASLMFFVYVGFCAFLWEASGSSEKQIKNKNLVKAKNGLGPEFAYSIFVVVVIVSIYGIYVTNYLPAKASKYVNYGYAYASADIQKAKEYFKQAEETPFNFDFGETSMKYSEMGLSAAYNPNLAQDIKNKHLTDAIEVMRGTIERVDNYPIYLYRYANLILMQDLSLGRQFSRAGEEALDRAIELAPKRPEARVLKAQSFAMFGQKDKALALMEEVKSESGNDKNTEWQYISLLRQIGEIGLALTKAEELQATGFMFGSWRDISWMADEYAKKKQFSKAIALFEIFLSNQTLDIDGAMALARLYLDNGQKMQAKNILERIVQNNGPKKAEAEQLLRLAQ